MVTGDLLRVLVTLRVVLHLSGIRFYLMRGELAETAVRAAVTHVPASPLVFTAGEVT